MKKLIAVINVLLIGLIIVLAVRVCKAKRENDAYNQSIVTQVRQSFNAYNHAGPDLKKQIASIVKMRFGNVDQSILPDDLKTFVGTCNKGPTYGSR